MATDLAEIIGGAVALNLLFGLPLLAGGVITGVDLDDRAHRADPARAARLRTRHRGAAADHHRRVHRRGLLRTAGCRRRHRRPRAAFRGRGLGAPGRVDPRRDDHAARHLRALGARPRPVPDCRATAADPPPALGDEVGRDDRHGHRRHREPRDPAARGIRPAGRAGHRHAEGAYAALQSTLGPAVATIFAVGLLASGLASTSVGAYAGAEIMHGLLQRAGSAAAAPAGHAHSGAADPRRRASTRPRPSCSARWCCRSASRSRSSRWSGSPRRRGLLGDFANRWFTTAAGALCAVLLVTLNVVLLVLVFTG